MVDGVERARAAFARRAWGEAFGLLSREEALDADDLQRLATAAQLSGHPDEGERAWERAFAAYLDAGDAEGATRCAFWVVLELMLRGEEARAGGWQARAERAAGELEPQCAARGFLLLPACFGALYGGDPAVARDLAREMVDIGQRCGDKDLLAFGLLSSGQAALALGDTAHGMRFLDEVMVAVTMGDVSPIPAGIVYCAVVEACGEVFDVGRAATWTEAFHVWCESQPELVPYRGQCLVHRAEILQAHGGWAAAAAEVEQARVRLSEPAHPALGFALYQQAELHRLRGELAEAEGAYRAAHEQGRDPSPGLALLRLAQGNVTGAAAAVRRMLDESVSRTDRVRVLAAAVEILLASGDRDGARSVAEDLAEVARANPVPVLVAMSHFALGSVLVAGDDPGTALPELRRACSGYLELDMPYEAARARVLAADALRAVGDRDAADLELDAARATFERLGAGPDLARTAPIATDSAGAGPLSERERDVLRHIAAGETNREAAAVLSISEHTVARHVQNIFSKLGVTSRAAATAYAYEHGLLRRGGDGPS